MNNLFVGILLVGMLLLVGITLVFGIIGRRPTKIWRYIMTGLGVIIVCTIIGMGVC
jgi:hypothetical protein